MATNNDCDMNKVSVIIPIYNMERYLCRALDSLLAQTYQNWEAVMVDDGSTDRSHAIAESYCKRDNRFRLFRQENQGQGVARNNALRQISGDYVMYLDPDDMFHPQAMEICVNASLRDGTDMVTFTYDHLYYTLNKWLHRLHLGEMSPRPRCYRNYDFHVTENIFEHATECNRPTDVNRQWMVKHCQAWRCMLKADLARKAQFAAGVNYQDVPWWGQILLNVRRTTITRLPLYFYYPNPGSFIMSAKLETHIRSLKVILNQSDLLFENAEPEQRRAWNQNFRTSFCNYLKKKERKLAKFK